jgi:hypothetical protein
MIARLASALTARSADHRAASKALRCAAIRDGAARWGLDLSALPDDAVARAAEHCWYDFELHGRGPEGATAALAEAVRRTSR